MFTLPTQTHRTGDLVGDARRDAGANRSMTTWPMVERAWVGTTSFATSEHTSPAHLTRPFGAST